MFKFRRRSLCSSKEIVTPKGDDGETKENGQGDNGNFKKVRSRSEEKESKTVSRCSVSTSTDKKNTSVTVASDKEPAIASPTMTNKWSGEKLKANFKKSFLGQVMCDRKRKERHESVSQDQERKVQRSQSDDEGGSDTKTDFKRTLSHDNFQHKRNDFEMEQPKPPIRLSTSAEPCRTHFLSHVQLLYARDETEARRQLERSMNYTDFSTPSSSKKNPHRRRHRSSNRKKDEQDIESWFVQENNQENQELDSPLSSSESSPTKNIPTLKIDESSSGNESETVEAEQKLSFLDSIRGPISDGHVMLSPRSTFLAREAIDLPPSPPMQQYQCDPPLSRQSLGENSNTKMNNLSRLVTNLKMTLKDMEHDYEVIFGYRPSHADKLNNKEMKKCLMQLAKAKKDLKLLKEDPSAVQKANFLSLAKTIQRGSSEYLKSLEETVKEIDSTLENQRRKSNRPAIPEQMTMAELVDEKNLMQRQLLILEKRHGRPSTKSEKDIVRPLYDRYRFVKKLSVNSTKDLDLVPIMENVTLELPETNKEKPMMSRMQEIDTDDDGDVLDQVNESFNTMTLKELEKRQGQAKDEKRKLRAVLRRFESNFQESTGRPPLKEEKYSSSDMESDYQKYKRTRAIIRLLDVLIRKKKFPQLVVEKFED